MHFKYIALATLILISLNACAGRGANKTQPSAQVLSAYDSQGMGIYKKAEKDAAPKDDESIVYNEKIAHKDNIERERTIRDIRESYDIPSIKDDLFIERLPYGLFFHEPDLETWQAYYHFLRLRERVEDFPQVVPDSEYDIPVVFNDRVHRFLDYFQGSGRDSFSVWLLRSGKYIPMMKGILEAWGMPTDLVYMAMIESGFSLKARSYKGAVGPWQFIQPTARRYGLRVDSWVDERMNPEKSTVAAAMYLRDLYGMFESWELAAAGYNCGEERVQAAIEKFKVSDFWEISEYTLPRETKDYVPKFMAALIISKDPEKYGFPGIEYQEAEIVEKAHVPSQRSLKEVAGVIGVSGESLIELNPDLITGSTPPGDPYEIEVPFGYANIVAAKYDELSALKVAAIKGKTTSHAYYKVRRGDSLGKIASRYGVSVASLKNANDIRGSIIRTGQTLSIPGGSGVSYVRSGSAVKYKVRSGDTLTEIAARYRSSVSAIKSANNIRGSNIVIGKLLTIPGGSASSKSSAGSTVSYRIKRGDTLWNIASRYDVSVSDIKRWNNLKSSHLFTGDKIRIYE